jgi:hypothetical protein
MKHPWRLPISFLLGPSGAGKSFIGSHLGSVRDYLHLEIDQFPSDGIDTAALRAEWDEFLLSCNATPIAAELRRRVADSCKRGAVVSFPSRLTLSVAQIEAARLQGISVAILYGSAADCIGAFLARENQNGRGLKIDHWLSNNADAYLSFSWPEFAQFRIPVFDARGKRRKADAVARDVLMLPAIRF